MKYLKNVPDSMRVKILDARNAVERSKQQAKSIGSEYYDPRTRFGYGERDVEIFETLASHTAMAAAWAQLGRIFDDQKRPPDTWRFADACKSILACWETAPHRTSNEHKAHFERLAVELRQLAYEVASEPEFGSIGTMTSRVSIVNMLSDDDLKDLLDDLQASPAGQYVKADNVVPFTRAILTNLMPKFTAYLDWIASRAESIAAQPSISARPNRNSAERTYFVRGLSTWFRQGFGSPHDEVVASAASALFDETVTGDLVRKLRKVVEEDSSHQVTTNLPPVPRS